jgi:hypothetical protein
MNLLHYTSLVTQLQQHEHLDFMAVQLDLQYGGVEISPVKLLEAESRFNGALPTPVKSKRTKMKQS